MTSTARSSARADAEHARQQQLEHQQVVDACKELRALWPHLTGALMRDTTSAGATSIHSPSNGIHALVNHDVAEAHTEIARWLTTARAECLRILGIEFTRTNIRRTNMPAIIEAIPAWHHRLQQLNLPTAAYLAADAGHALRTARKAIGLTQPGYRLGTCPNHPETATPLIRLGAEGTLDESIYSSTDGTHTWLVATGAITWTRGVTIRCPHCHTTWAGPQALLILARRLTELGDTP